MATPTVLSEKLRRPEPSGLPRPRLERRLREGSAAGLDLVVAPPGAGKTTLLARVAAESGVPTAWYRVTADDGTEAVLVAHLARSLHDSLGIAVPRNQMSALLGALDAWSGPNGAVILDDLHEIAGTPAEKVLEQLVMLRPPRLRVIFGSRRHPDLNIPRLRVSGQLREVTSDDLRFRSWEVEELFFGVFHQPLPPESAAALTRRTEGWAAGLQLFHLATAQLGPAQQRQAVADLGGRSKLIRSYLARNVLAELPEEQRQFLLRTCTLGSLTGPLCDALLGTTGSARLLNELEQRQLFTSSADDGQTFRYHEVLRTHLELALVDEYGGAGARSWYAKAASLLEAAEQTAAAARAYGRAEDWESVARLIQQESDGASVGSSAAHADLLFPPALVEHDPWLALADARRRVRDGSLAAAADGFRRAESLLDEPRFQDRCRQERTLVSGWLGGPRLPRPRGDSDAGPEHWSVTLRDTTRRVGVFAPAGVTAGGLLAEGAGYLLAGDFRRSSLALQAVIGAPGAEGTTRVLAELGLTITDLLNAGEPEPSGRLGELINEAETQALPWVARLARGLHAAVAGATGRHGSGSAEVLAECERAGDTWGAALVQLAAGIALQRQESSRAAPLLRDAANRFAVLDAPVLQCWAEALASRQENDVDAARLTAERARLLQAPGAESVALGAVARLDPQSSAMAEAQRLAATNGIRRTAAIGPAWDRRTRRTPVIARPVEQVPPGVLTVRCLGGFHLLIGREELPIEQLRPRARSLLRMLAISPSRDVHRERLIDALWPGADVVAGTRRLQVAVSSIRQLLEQSGLVGSDIILRHADAYQFAPPAGSSVDVQDFERLVREATTRSARGDLAGAIDLRQEALELYVGELLPEDGPADHVVPERERLQVAAAATAAEQAEDCKTAGSVRAAIAAARMSVRLDPYQDLPWQVLVELHEESGDPTAADQVRREQLRARADLDLTSAR